MRRIVKFIPAVIALYMAGCDDGRIYDEAGGQILESGFSAIIEGDIAGCDDYQDDSKYSVAVAAFKEGDSFAAVSKPVADGVQEISIANIPNDVSTVELCVINRLRERVFTFLSEDVAGIASNQIIMNAGKINVGKFPTVESKIFSTTCSQCHGATGYSAAGLSLMPEEAYSMLVEEESTVVEGGCRVVPGNAAASTLWQAVATDISAGWAYFITPPASLTREA